MLKQALLVSAGLASLAACGGTATTPSSSGQGSTSAPAASAAGSTTLLATGSTSLGTVLVDAGTGRTLYYFTPEQGGKVVCANTATCNTAWPPETASGTPAAPNGVTGQFGVVALPGGTSEVTYNGWPLHTYAVDTAAGQTNGQGVGGKWFVATPSLTASGSGSGAGSNSSAAASPSASPSGYGY